MIRHVILLTFTDPADAAEAKRRLDELPPKIEAIRSWEVALPFEVPEGGPHLCLISTHDDRAGLRAYLEHPDHHELVTAWLRPRLSGRSVCDYETNA
jgi:hypothetical protein